MVGVAIVVMVAFVLCVVSFFTVGGCARWWVWFVFVLGVTCTFLACAIFPHTHTHTHTHFTHLTTRNAPLSGSLDLR